MLIFTLQKKKTPRLIYRVVIKLISYAYKWKVLKFNSDSVLDEK